ncbi:protein kinase [Nocardiopsis sp. NPDC007018]|uniref:protein kinase domain-containing protein n=1 Tax=Nocardiopsis sp. NPDC007018 TaxID=3155721 RepID=UPI0033E21A8B
MHPLRPEDPRRLGPYRLLRRVGAGGMGVVFLAVAADGDGDDLAAVKAVRAEYAEDAEFRARFAGEVELARRVRGPYTARVLDADTEGPRPWLATEYVSGPSLHHAVRDGGPFPEDSLRALAAGLARALDAIHSVGLIHRDLKPSNVLLSPRGPQVIDFGIARATDATALTRTGQTLGTPAYMSPEQATGAHLGPGSDLFAFGGVLLFAGTGRQPFGTGDPAALLYRVVNEEPDLDGLPEGLAPLVDACLAKAPADRPALAEVLAELSGTALPEAGADDPTAWLPTAIATRVMGTVAYTRAQAVAPDVSGTEESLAEGGSREAPGAPEAAGNEDEDAGADGPIGSAGALGTTRAGRSTDDTDSPGTAGAGDAAPTTEPPGTDDAREVATGHGAPGERESRGAVGTEAASGGSGIAGGEDSGGNGEGTGTAGVVGAPGADREDGAPDAPNGGDAHGDQVLSELPSWARTGGSSSALPSTGAARGVGSTERPVPDAEPPAEGTPGAGSTDTGDAPGTGRAPGAGATPDAAGTPGTRRRSGAASAPVPSTRDAARPAPGSPAGPAAPAARRDVDAPDPASGKVLGGTAVTALVLVVGLVLAIDSRDAADEERAEATTPSAPRDAAPTQEAAPEEEPAEIEDVTFLDGDRFAILTNAGVHLYETDESAPIRRLDDESDPRRLGRSELVSDPTGSSVAVQRGSPTRSTVFVWDLDDDEEYEVTLAEGFGGGEPLALSPGGGNLYAGPGLVSGREREEVIAYDTRSGEEVYAVDIPENGEGLKGTVSALGTTPDGTLLIAALTTGIAVWDAGTGEPVPGVPELREWSTSVSGPMAVSDGLVAAASYEQLLLVDPRSDRAPESFTVPFDGDPASPESEPWITSLSFGEDGDTIVAAGHVGQQQGYIQVWDRDGTPVNERWSSSEQYRAVRAAPTGGDVLVAPYLLGNERPHPLRLLDGDLSVAMEYELPTVTDDA